MVPSDRLLLSTVRVVQCLLVAETLTRNAVMRATETILRRGTEVHRSHVALPMTEVRAANESTLSSRRHEVLRGTADTGSLKARGGSAAEPR